MPSKPDRWEDKLTIRYLLLTVVVVGIVTVGIQSTMASESNNPYRPTSLGVQPVADEAIHSNATIISHNDGRIDDLAFLQEILHQSKLSGEKESVGLSQPEFQTYVESVQSVDQAPNIEGLYVRYDNKVYRLTLTGLL